MLYDLGFVYVSRQVVCEVNNGSKIPHYYKKNVKSLRTSFTFILWINIYQEAISDKYLLRISMLTRMLGREYGDKLNYFANGGKEWH